MNITDEIMEREVTEKSEKGVLSPRLPERDIDAQRLRSNCLTGLREITSGLFFVVSWVAAFSLIVAVRVYQWTISPILGPVCRFHPSCSNYFILAVRKYGPVWGTIKGLYRITRCHPWNPGGYDPP